MKNKIFCFGFYFFCSINETLMNSKRNRKNPWQISRENGSSNNEYKNNHLLIPWWELSIWKRSNLFCIDEQIYLLICGAKSKILSGFFCFIEIDNSGYLLLAWIRESRYFRKSMSPRYSVIQCQLQKWLKIFRIFRADFVAMKVCTAVKSTIPFHL